jgi:hypothetical protein
MKHIFRLLAAVMLTLSSFVGCTSHVDLTSDEVGPRSSGQIDRIVFTRSITGVITESGDTTHFDEKCGRYDHRGRAISGRVDGGERKEIKLNQVESVLMESEGLQGTRLVKFSMVPFIRTARQRSWLNLNGKTVQRGTTVPLRRGSGILSEDRSRFSGISLIGDSVVVNTHEVILQRTRFAPGKTAALIAGVGVIIGGIAALMAIQELRDFKPLSSH